MYRVLIVDDEPWVAYGISRLIDWEGEGFTVIGEAFDGLSAISWIKEHRPDVVISDIRMPGLDGIQLLDEMKKQQLDAEVILVSGYSEFEYAQKALRLGAFDYLLKQIDKVKITEAIRRLKIKLVQKHQASTELDTFLSDLFDLLDSDNNIKIGEFLENRGYKPEHPNFRFINCVYPYTTVSEGGEGVIAMNGMKYISFRTGQNKQSILLNYDEAYHPIALLDFISTNLTEPTNLGISPLGHDSTSLSKLYHEADIALFSSIFYTETRIVQYKENEPMIGISSLMLQLELGIKEMKLDCVHECLDQISEECTNQQLFVDQISNIYNQIVSLIHKYYGNSSIFHEIEFSSYYQLVRNYGSIDQLFERVKAIFDFETSTELPILNEQIKSIMAFIDSSFTEDLMFGTIAKQSNISIGYLSYLIKKGTGKTYSEYISSKRISLAKELLRDNSLSVQEVVERVGYKDYFHFNKLFKKHVGLTPSKFRKL